MSSEAETSLNISGLNPLQLGNSKRFLDSARNDNHLYRKNGFGPLPKATEKY